MARRVKTTSAVRDFIREAGVNEICRELNTLSVFRNAISQTISGWGEFEKRDLCDEQIVLMLSSVLEDWESIEDALRARMELPPEWRQDETKWDLYRSAIAVVTLQAYYDSL